MPDTYYTAEYCGRTLTDEGFVQGGFPLNFEHFARTFLNDLTCISKTGSPTGLQTTAELVEQHGSFGYFKFTFSQTGHNAKWVNALPQGESTAASTLSASKQKTVAFRTKVRNFMDNVGIPAAPTERERAVNFLLSLDMNGHHPGFKTVRDSYVNVLNDARGVQLNHWMLKEPLYQPQGSGWPLDPVVVQAMLDEMGAHAQTAPCRTMHYAMMYGGLAILLDTPVT